MKFATLRTGLAGLLALVTLVFAGDAMAADSDALIGQWLDNLPNGFAMLTTFTATNMTFHGVAPDGTATPDSTLPVTYTKKPDGTISVAPKEMADQALTVTVKDPNTLLMQFPGAETRTLVRQKADAKKK